MRIVSKGDNVHEMSNPVYLENKKKKNSKCHLLKTLYQSAEHYVSL